ncbi:MAG TPA: hypothetical protein VK837_08090, partial [Longimicrobiales bacterium]|nr:hypothetical protein [Longimicrobiales bacterium]
MMARHRAPSRRTVVAVAAIGALTALAFLLAPGGSGRVAGLEVVLLGPDGAGGPGVRFDAATLARLRSPPPPRAEAEDTLGPAALQGVSPALP